MNPKYSIVIPLKDEEDNIAELIDEIESVMNAQNAPWEIICIDDGSCDNTLTILNQIKRKKSHIRGLRFTKNFGQTSAFDAGFKVAKGEFIITLDGDGQNDPKDIPKLIYSADKFDLVCGIRQKRQDTWIKRWLSSVANFVRSRLCQDGIKDTGCSLKLYRKNCLQQIRLYHGMHRFLPALFQIEGFRVGQIQVNHRKRKKGKTKYSLLNRSLNTVADMFAVMWMRRRKLHYQIEREI